MSSWNSRAAESELVASSGLWVHSFSLLLLLLSSSSSSSLRAARRRRWQRAIEKVTTTGHTGQEGRCRGVKLAEEFSSPASPPRAKQEFDKEGACEGGVPLQIKLLLLLLPPSSSFSLSSSSSLPAPRIFATHAIPLRLAAPVECLSSSPLTRRVSGASRMFVFFSA